MGQFFLKANSSTASPVPSTLWTLEVHYCVQWSLPPAPLLTQLNLVHVLFLDHAFKYYLPNYAWVFQVVSLFQFPNLILYACLFSPLCATCPAHPLPHSFIRLVIFSEKYKSWSSPLCSFSPLPCYLVPLRPKYLPLHPILKHLQPIFFPLC
jgi:hypothetical protein